LEQKTWCREVESVIDEGLGELSDRADDGLDQIDTFRVAGARDIINERLD
jgi:hypothetical protein